MELLDDPPGIDLGDSRWPIWTHRPQQPPARFVGAGSALRSIVASGCAVAGLVEQSVLSTGCRVGAGARVETSVLLPDVTVGRDCVLRRVVVDSGCRVPDATVLAPGRVGTAQVAEGPDGPVALVTAASLAALAARTAPTQRELLYANR